MNYPTKGLFTTSSEQNWTEIDRVLVELDHLKRHSLRLDMLNQLHARIAGVLSISGMIEAYSVWLMPVVKHELIGYNNRTRRKKHLFCSGHGPNRRKAIAFAERMLKTEEMVSEEPNGEGDLYAHKWIFETADDAGILLLLNEGRQLTAEEHEIINASLVVLGESLQRGLEYEELFERASHDPLTGLFNRRVFEERICSMMESAKRYHRPLTMMALDLDKFKSINDHLGHQAGDEALKAVAEVLSKAIRSADLLVRMGGDEFLVILDNTSQANARYLAERLCRGVDALNIRADEETRLGISIGVSEWRQDEELGDWLERCDDFLYHAKAQGRSRMAMG